MSDPKPSPGGSAISASQAQKLLDAYIVSIAKKVAAGQPLSRQEVQTLEAKISSSRDVDLGAEGFAKNQVQLADALGVDRKTINRWLKEEGNPGAKADGRYDVAAWREWARENGHKLGDDLDSGRLKAENLLLQNRLLQRKLDILERAYLPAVEVERVGSALGVAIRKVVCQLHLCAPSIVGLTVAEADVALREKEDEIMEQLHTLHTGLEDMKKVDVKEVSDDEAPAG